mmetsp:Transcript_60831/g.157815  ORF Transcript_60831/g.157815 Transcript_60831/m.157815 type:complete len:324 (+) Transcript_60831:813-1784(+)
MDEAPQVRGVLFHECVHRLAATTVALRLLDSYAQLGRQPLHVLPVRQVVVRDPRGPRQELHGEALAPLLLSLGQKELAHDNPERPIAATDPDHAVVWNLKVRKVLVRLRRYLPQHVAAAIQYADRVVAKGRVAENLRCQILDVLCPEGPLCVDVLDWHGHLQACAVAHAEQSAVRDEAEAHLLVDLSLLGETVRREHDQALAPGRVVRKTLEDGKKNLDDGNLLTVDLIYIVLLGRVDPKSEDDDVPRVHLDQIPDILLGLRGRGLCLHVGEAQAARGRLLENLLAEAEAVCEDEDVLLGHGAPVHRRPLAYAAVRVGVVLQV